METLNKVFNIILWAIIIIIVIIGIKCLAFAQTAPDGQEWACRAYPPKGTENGDVFNITAYNEDKAEAEKEAKEFCEKLFKVECKTDCKLVKKGK